MSVQTPYSRENSSRPIVFPLLLIGLGATLLALNFGYISWETVRGAFQYWPVIFIALGVEALITRRAPWGALILAIIATVIFSSNSWMRLPPWHTQQQPGPRINTIQTQSINGASRAVVSFTVGGAQLNIDALQEPGTLARWQGGEGNTPSYRVRDGVGRLDLELTGGRGIPGFWRMNPFTDRSDDPRTAPMTLQIAAGIPLEIEGRIGASESTVDLRQLNVTRLALDAGASNSTIYLPSLSESTSATIRGGASNLEIVVPENVRTRINSEGGLSSVRVDPAKLSQVDGSTTVYQSRSAEPGAHTLDVTLRLGASSVNIR